MYAQMIHHRHTVYTTQNCHACTNDTPQTYSIHHTKLPCMHKWHTTDIQYTPHKTAMHAQMIHHRHTVYTTQNCHACTNDTPQTYSIHHTKLPCMHKWHTTDIQYTPHKTAMHAQMIHHRHTVYTTQNCHACTNDTPQTYSIHHTKLPCMHKWYTTDIQYTPHKTAMHAQMIHHRHTVYTTQNCHGTITTISRVAY